MLAKNLKEAMARKKISGAVLARQTGYSKAAISQYINGINIPSAERVETIAAVLGVSIEELTAEQAFVHSTEQKPVQTKPGILTTKQAARLLHVHENYIRDGLKYARPGFEYGSAVPPSKGHKKWRYRIYANKFTEITGIPVNI